MRVATVVRKAMKEARKARGSSECVRCVHLPCSAPAARPGGAPRLDSVDSTASLHARSVPRASLARSHARARPADPAAAAAAAAARFEHRRTEYSQPPVVRVSLRSRRPASYTRLVM